MGYLGGSLLPLNMLTRWALRFALPFLPRANPRIRSVCRTEYIYPIRISKNTDAFIFALNVPFSKLRH
jgi:hypothetical protein